jgi:hypothetical protein
MKKDNAEKLATLPLVTQDEDKQSKNTTRYVLDTTICKTNTNNVNKTCSLLQTNTINVNKTCSLLQTTLDNEEPNIVSEVFSIYPHLTFINVTTPTVDVTSISTQNLFQGRTFNSKLVYFISHEATSIF